METSMTIHSRMATISDRLIKGKILEEKNEINGTVCHSVLFVWLD